MYFNYDINSGDESSIRFGYVNFLNVPPLFEISKNNKDKNNVTLEEKNMLTDISILDA